MLRTWQWHIGRRYCVSVVHGGRTRPEAWSTSLHANDPSFLVPEPCSCFNTPPPLFPSTILTSSSLRLHSNRLLQLHVFFTAEPMCGHAHVAPPQAFHTCLKRCRLIRSHRRTSFSGANASTGLNLFREKFNMFVLE